MFLNFNEQNYEEDTTDYYPDYPLTQDDYLEIETESGTVLESGTETESEAEAEITLPECPERILFVNHFTIFLYNNPKILFSLKDYIDLKKEQEIFIADILNDEEFDEKATSKLFFDYLLKDRSKENIEEYNHFFHEWRNVV